MYFVQDIIEVIIELVKKYKQNIKNYCDLYEKNNFYETSELEYDDYIHYEACKLLSYNLRSFLINESYNVEIKTRPFNEELLLVKTYKNTYEIPEYCAEDILETVKEIIIKYKKQTLNYCKSYIQKILLEGCIEARYDRYIQYEACCLINKNI